MALSLMAAGESMSVSNLNWAASPPIDGSCTGKIIVR